MMKSSNLSGTQEATQVALAAVESIPRCDDAPVFAEPWEAEVFALCLSLHEQGLFTWTEWATALSQSIRTAQQSGDPDLGDTYYSHWLATIEQLVIEKKLGDSKQLSQLYNAWDDAARRTAHGEPIEL